MIPESDKHTLESIVRDALYGEHDSGANSGDSLTGSVTQLHANAAGNTSLDKVI